MTPWLKRAGRWTYLVLVSLSSAYLILQVVHRTDWYRDHLFKQLLHGSAERQERAALALARLQAEPQLMRALQAPGASSRDLARRALETIWFNAAGPDAYRMLETAASAMDQDELEQAKTILDDLVERYPTFAEGWNRRASLHWQLGEYELTISDGERSLFLNPNHYGAWQGIGVAHLELGKVDEACRALRQALRIIPYDEPTRRSLRRCEELLRIYPHPTASSTRRMII